MNPCLLAVALLQVGSPVDEGVLVVRVDTIEVARESFRLTHGRLSRGESGSSKEPKSHSDKSEHSYSFHIAFDRVRHRTVQESRAAAPP